MTMTAIDGRLRADHRFDLVTALLSGWFVVGLLLDGYAHANLAELETFFTPWHAVFYSGFVVTAAWTVWPVLRRLRQGVPVRDAVPVGYGATLVALPVFLLAGLGDMTWHLAFGVEQGLAIAFSPTHLLLAASMAVIVTTPARSGWATTVGAPTRRQLPLLLGLTFGMVVVFLLMSYAEATAWSPQQVVAALSVPDDGSGDTFLARHYAMAVMVTTVALVAPLLMLARRGPVPAGAATLVFAAVALMGQTVAGFAAPAVWVVAVACGAAADLLVRWWRPEPGRPLAVVAFAAAAAWLVWAALIGYAVVTVGVPSAVEFWTGLPFVAAGVAALLAVVTTAPTVSRGTR
ncbi:MAG TPA: hypothetical protein VFY17_11980 [Pilimelia sp.]|nr:hypothetical protein [Pilimelia sp.]